jgi:hypothetical protein
MKGIIYDIKCNETNEIYIGSTIKSLKERIRQHINHRVCVSKQIIERNNYSVNILEEIEFIDIKELRIKEQFYINSVVCINKRTAYILDEDEEKRIIKYKEYQKKYRNKHKDDNKIYMTLYYKNNKEKLKQYGKQNYELQIK